MSSDALDQLVTRLEAAGTDFGRIWGCVSPLAADIVEIRHVPPSPVLDGLRNRTDFVRYVEEEARVFPRSFRECRLGLKVERHGNTVIWNPLSFSGPLATNGREVTIRFRVELQFEDNRLHRINGSPTPENSKSEIIEWLQSVDSIGGFNPPAPMGGEKS